MADRALSTLPLKIRETRRRRVSLAPFLQAPWLWAAALLVCLLIVLPIVYLMMRALGAGSGLLDVFLNPSLAATLARTAGLAAAVTFSTVLIALPLAWLTTRSDLPLRRMWTVLSVLPLVIPSYVGAYLFISFLGPRGLLAQALDGITGGKALPSLYGFSGSWLVLTLLTYPYILLSLRAAFQRLNPALEEAALSLGHTPAQVFWRVTLPQVRPALVAGGLLVALYVLREFGAVAMLRYDTFTRVIYTHYRSSFDRSTAAALSLVLVALTLLVLWLESRTRGRGSLVSPGQVPRPQKIVRLGAWRWPALLFCVLIVGSALVLPAGVLLYWLLRGLQAGEVLVPLLEAVRSSLLAGGLAALASLVAALPLATLVVRQPGWAIRLAERVAYTGYALPGIVIALALVYFGANYALPLYQSLPMLVLAYVILFLSLALGALRSALLQVNPNLEEAARGLGHPPLRVFFKVTLPMIRPGILSALALVFLTAMKELPATLLLSPLGFKTLAAAVWSSVSEAYFAQAAAPALLLILVSSLPLALITLRENNA
ncbi:MAG: iron ABC transporter permease [Chloroflexi bacterium]|nr:iron ABC transporter permease [Chloroflexota bacterium]